MILKDHQKIYLLFFFYFFSINCFAKVTIFDQDRDIIPVKIKSPLKTNKPKKIKSVIFSERLIGIQQLGEYYSLIFQTEKGEQNRYKWKKSKRVEIIPGYTINSVNNRSVNLKLSKGLFCNKNSKYFITCKNKDTMHISLSHFKSIAKNKQSLKRVFPKQSRQKLVQAKKINKRKNNNPFAKLFSRGKKTIK
jgi:hypothetical protein